MTLYKLSGEPVKHSFVPFGRAYLRRATGKSFVKDSPAESRSADGGNLNEEDYDESDEDIYLPERKRKGNSNNKAAARRMTMIELIITLFLDFGRRDQIPRRRNKERLSQAHS